MDLPQMMVLPWELLFEQEYLGLRLRYPIVRYLDLPDPPRPLADQPPLRVLVAVSQPKDTRPLQVDTELAHLSKALTPLADKAELDVLDPARSDGLLAKLRQGCHVLHYIGHGLFKDTEGYLILEDADERPELVSASLIGRMVADTGLRLVVLNACQTAVPGLDRTFGGVAHQLVRAGMPAVVAMQMAIADGTAVAFSRHFYGALADGWPVDAAVQEGRRSIMTALGNEWNKRVDWAIPTLYMRAPDGLILRP
jgi:CHAT domain-containing protein